MLEMACALTTVPQAPRPLPAEVQGRVASSERLVCPLRTPVLRGFPNWVGWFPSRGLGGGRTRGNWTVEGLAQGS